jgi:Ni/Fe-hydrogenase subunit HybB-like protein
MEMSSLEEEGRVYEVAVACYSVALIIVTIQLCRFKLYREIRSRRCYIHISILMASICMYLSLAFMFQKREERGKSYTCSTT